MSSHTIRVNQYRDGSVEHVNISFIDATHNITYGNGLSIGSGVQDETLLSAQRISSSPSTYSYTDYVVSDQQFQAALAAAKAADGLGNYAVGLSNNSVDFANEILKIIGLGEWAISSILVPGSDAAIYAGIVQQLSENEYFNVEESHLQDPLFSDATMLDLIRFGESAKFLDFTIGDPFYWGFPDPDALADWHLQRMHLIAPRLGMDMDWADLDDKVMQGVASPIVIDLNGDGVKTISYAASQVLFDIDGDGIKDKTAWATGEDAFLAIDKNGNGKIDGVGELFGGLAHGEGFAKLQTFDSNNDGVVNALDAEFGKLLLWKDANLDGVTDEGELTSLAEQGVTSLGLQYEDQNVYDANGNLHGETATAIVNGSAVDMSDIYFKYRRYAGATEEELELVRQAQLLTSTMAGFGATSGSEGLAFRPTIDSLLPNATYPGA